jgi:hypothetical protein
MCTYTLKKAVKPRCSENIKKNEFSFMQQFFKFSYANWETMYPEAAFTAAADFKANLREELTKFY